MITVIGGKLIIEGFETPRGRISYQEIDLTPYQGEVVRVYLDDNLNIIINPVLECYWQLAEMVLPPRQIQESVIGSREIEEWETLYIHRSATDEDILDDPGGTVELIGFEWQNYRRGSEWDTACASNRLTITWLTERRPKEGEEYPVTIKKTREVPDMESVEVPLDLTKINIDTYELPV